MQNLTIAAEPLRFKIALDPTLSEPGQAVSGRLLIFMTAKTKPLDVIEPDFLNPEAVFVSGIEITNLEPGKSIEINPDVLSFPKSFSAAPAGGYQVMALLDTNHSYTYDGMGEGDLYSNVVKINLPIANTVQELILNEKVPGKTMAVPENVKFINFESPALSAFWGRPIIMKASVVLPPNYDKSKSETYPTVYNVHGYGGNHLGPLRGVSEMQVAMSAGKRPEMIYVYLNANNSLGHHVFADSANNGPWGRALTTELIPYLEKQFRMDAKVSGRFLTGHSSGGWSTLWLQVNYPDVFGGTWSTSPDPVDFHSFTGPDLTLSTPQNFFHGADGKPYNLIRDQGKDIMSFEEYARLERATGYYGGQLASFEAVFSPKGDDGQPMTLFDRDTGRIDPIVQKAWGKYDISRILQDNWKTLEPKLKGKIHIVVGTADTFHLDEAVRLLDAKLKALGSDAKIEYIEGRTHFDLYRDGLSDRIANEMYAIARPKAKIAATK
ncbi:MAG: alpha/beta hydrolase [Pyrinomonadaceae bacterium]